jgi:spermidine synthase
MTDIQNPPSIKIFSLFAIILIEGFVSISVEILTIRQLIPFVGNSVVVTSLIIGVFLLFLAIGYRRGGTVEDDHRGALIKNFTIAGIWLGIGLSYVFVSVFFALSQSLTAIHPLISLSLYLLIILAPLTFFLGQTIPISTHFFSQGFSVGKISGNALYLSTIGSFLGAILTSLLLLNYVGVAWTVFINCLLLILLILLLIDFSAKMLFLGIFLLVAMAFIYRINVSEENVFFLKTNTYANYQVEEDIGIPPYERGKIFMINNSVSSYLDDARRGARYIELIKKILYADLKLTDKKILVIGAGGFTLSAESDYGNDFTYLDIDKDISEVAEKYFISNINGHFIAQDARIYLADIENEYDVIVSDAYNHRYSIPSYLLTQEYLTHLRSALRPNGYALFNIIASPLLEDAYSKRVDNTISAVFLNCMKIPLNYREQLTNIVYVCKKTPQEYDTMTYKDNLNRAELDFFNSRMAVHN